MYYLHAWHDPGDNNTKIMNWKSSVPSYLLRRQKWSHNNYNDMRGILRSHFDTFGYFNEVPFNCWVDNWMPNLCPSVYLLCVLYDRAKLCKVFKAVAPGRRWLLYKGRIRNRLVKKKLAENVELTVASISQGFDLQCKWL